MRFNEVKLSDGQAVKVRQLGLFELDDIETGIPGPYKYTVHLFGGDDYEIVYDIEAALVDPPQKPSVAMEQAEAGNPEYYQWQDWLRYQEALAHQITMYEAYALYCERVAEYIKRHCLPDGLQIATAADWDALAV